MSELSDQIDEAKFITLHLGPDQQYDLTDDERQMIVNALRQLEASVMPKTEPIKMPR